MGMPMAGVIISTLNVSRTTELVADPSQWEGHVARRTQRQMAAADRDSPSSRCKVHPDAKRIFRVRQYQRPGDPRTVGQCLSLRRVFAKTLDGGCVGVVGEPPTSPPPLRLHPRVVATVQFFHLFVHDLE